MASAPSISRAAETTLEDRDRTKQFVIKRKPFHHRLDRGRHDIEREHLAAEEIFEAVNDEDDGRDLENPERHHGKRVGEEKLDQSRHEERNERREPGHGVVRQNDETAEIEEDRGDRQDRDRGVNQPAAQENAETVAEITHRLGQEGIDLTLANVGRDLPFVLGRRDEVADQDREQVVVDHRTVVVAAHAAAALAENRAPKEDGADQRNDPEDRAQEIVPAIDEGVLDPEIEDGEIFLRLHGGI